MWDAVSGDKLKTFAHKHIVKTVAFSSDGKNLLTGSNEKILRIFDLNNSDSGKVLSILIFPCLKCIKQQYWTRIICSTSPWIKSLGRVLTRPGKPWKISQYIWKNPGILWFLIQILEKFYETWKKAGHRFSASCLEDWNSTPSKMLKYARKGGRLN